MTSESDEFYSKLSETLPLLLLGIFLILFGPIIIISLIFGYLSWAAWCEKKERRFERTTLVVFIGFFFCERIWEFAKAHADFLLGSVLNNEKIKVLLSMTPIRYGFLAYFVFLPVIAVYLHFKRQPSLTAYCQIRAVLPIVLKPIAILLAVLNFLIFIFVKSSRIIGVICALMTLYRYYDIFGEISTQRSVWLFVFELVAYPATFCLAYGLIFHSQDDTTTRNEIKNYSGDLVIGDLLKPTRKVLSLNWNDINHHIHILGQPGAGKSVLLKNIYAHQISTGQGLLMLDLKADIDVKNDFISLLSASNRLDKLVLIDLSNPEMSAGYNPLMVGNATELKDKIIGAIEWSEPYYKKVSERVLLTVLRAFVHVRDFQQKIVTLEDLHVAISSVQPLTILAEQVNDEAIKQDLNQLIAGFSRELIKDLEGLRTDLALLVQSEFGSILKDPFSINILDAIFNGSVVLVNLDGQTYNESAKRFARLLLGDLRSASGTIVNKLSKVDRPQFTVIIDEFADIVSTEDMAQTFVGFLNRCRGSGIGVIIAHQSLGDFKNPTVKSQILDSTETLFSFVQKDPDTCEILASIAGTKETWEQTEQTSEFFAIETPTGRGSRKLVQEYIYHPNEFKNLSTGVAIYMAKKPTRHGVVRVKYVEIPAIDLSELTMEHPDRSQVASLNLSQALYTQKTAYNQAMKTTSNQRGTLEI